MISQFAYINTSKNVQTLEISYKDNDGKTQKKTLSLNSRDIIDNQKIAAQLGLPDKDLISNVSVNENTINLKGEVVNKKVSLGMKPSSFSLDEIMKNSVILDIETQNVMSGASITQVAMYDIDSKEAKFIIPESNLLIQDKMLGESGYDASVAKMIDLDDSVDHLALKRIHTMRDMIQSGRQAVQGVDTTDNEQVYKFLIKNYKNIISDPNSLKKIEEEMASREKFQAKQYVQNEDILKKAKLDVDDAQRVLISKISKNEVQLDDLDKYFRASMGITTSEAFGEDNLDVVAKRSLRNIVAEDMPNMFKGKVLWIANAAFESKQFGAHLRGFEHEVFSALKAKSVENIPDNLITFSREFRAGLHEDTITKFNKAYNTDYLTKNPFLGIMEGISEQRGDPFYVTGSEYGKAKQEAYGSGDFRKLYDVFKKTTKAGSVRDVLDLVRMQQSYLHSTGLIEADRPSSLGVEIQQRFANLSLNMKESDGVLSFDDMKQSLLMKETHVAIGDVLSEERVIKASIDHLEALSAFEKTGKVPVEALTGKGDLFRAFTVGGLQDFFNKGMFVEGQYDEGLQDVQLRARAGRMLEDLVSVGYHSAPRNKAIKGVTKRQLAQNAEGIVTKVETPINKRAEERLYQFGDILNELESTRDYSGADKDRFLVSFKQKFSTFFDQHGSIIKGKEQELLSTAKNYQETASDQVAVFERRLQKPDLFKNFMNGIKSFTGQQAKPAPKVLTSIRAREESFFKSLKEEKTYNAFKKKDLSQGSIFGVDDFKNLIRNNKGKVGYGVAGVASLMLAGLFQDRKDEQKSVLLGDYDDFLDAQAKFHGNSNEYIKKMKEKYGVPAGMSETGIAPEMRKMLTDFGSPYQGPFYSLSVFEDQDLLRERNRHMRAMFGERHFSEKGDVGYFLKSNVSSLFKKQQGLKLPGAKSFFIGTPLSDTSNYHSLIGKDLVEQNISLSEYDINVEDGDTIVLQRKGSNNSELSKFMGNTGGQFTFRLAGIDSPETAHQGRKAQPYAESSKQALTDMISGASDLKLVMRKNDITYGRQVAMIYADGKNLNIEMLKRGAAAYLPFKHKGKGSMFKEEAFEKAQEGARSNRRGMWKTSYFQAYSEIVKGSGETITFNTLANQTKVARSSNLMSVYAIMNKAAKGGMTDRIMSEIKGLNETLKYTQSHSSNSVFKDDLHKTTDTILDMQAFGYNPNSILSSLDEIKTDIAFQIHNSSAKIRESSNKNNVNNFRLSKESLNASAVYSQEIDANKDIQRKRTLDAQVRLRQMEKMQHSALGNLFNSPIQHQRM